MKYTSVRSKGDFAIADRAASATAVKLPNLNLFPADDLENRILKRVKQCLS